MATQATTRRLSGDPRFFFSHAATLAVVTLIGFGLEATIGKADYRAMPAALYLHGAVFLGWCMLAMAQPWLIGISDRATHRRLGWLGAVLAPLMAISGMAVTVEGIAGGRLAPPNLWLALNGLTVLPFAALVLAAIILRRRTDWHRRLLASATILITAPAWARILPMDRLGPLGIPAITVIVLAFVGWGMAYDRRARGRIHPSWWWGAAAVAAPGILTFPLAFAPPLVALADAIAPG